MSFESGFAAELARFGNRSAGDGGEQGSLFLGKALTVPFPVDRTSFTYVKMPWRLLYELGVNSDADLKVNQIPNQLYAPKPSGGTRNENSRNIMPGMARGDNKKVSFKRINVQLKTPIGYRVSSTVTEQNRQCNYISFRCPKFVSHL